MKIFFYPHAYLRDRQLDTIRSWPIHEVINPEIARDRQGAQVSESKATEKKRSKSWKQRLPLLNLKRRPSAAPCDAVVYVWGGLIAKGPFIVDLDNPWSLVGYNVKAMPLYRGLIKYLLLSNRCQEIRCLSAACRQSLLELFGQAVYAKATVHYPQLKLVASQHATEPAETKFLFIGTQFEIKGGVSLLKAFSQVHAKHPHCHLDIVTHLPDAYQSLAAQCKGIQIHKAHYSRDQIHQQFMANADVLVLPTFMESFGMAALEALAHGLALIVTDVYALKEMAHDGYNGFVIKPPISSWNRYQPTSYFFVEEMLKALPLISFDTFEAELAHALNELASHPSKVLQMKQNSIQLFHEHFQN